MLLYVINVNIVKILCIKKWVLLKNSCKKPWIMEEPGIWEPLKKNLDFWTKITRKLWISHNFYLLNNDFDLKKKSIK